MRMRRGWSQRVVHDLRNPASTLRTAAYLLRRGVSDAGEAQRLLEVIERQSKQLLAMLDELANGFWAERGERVSRVEPVDLIELAPAPVAGHAEFQPETLLPVNGDPARLAQLLRLLCALRLGPADAPDPLVGRWEDGRVRLRRRFAALPELLEDPEALLHTPLPPLLADDGLGLHLPVAAAIARAHDGRLWIEREDGGVLAVHVELPAQSP
ncbi:MAG: histidine kinase dimerization/phospho-acceptor domain-containing protein [Pseudomonadota bacterium]|jgi:signal transduction histidine kinase